MTTDRHNDEEENKNSNEEDFGLPDFEFEELSEEEETSDFSSEPSSSDSSSDDYSQSEENADSIFGSDDPDHYQEEVSYDGGEYGSSYEESSYEEESSDSGDDDWVPKYRQETDNTSKNFIILIVISLVVLAGAAFAFLKLWGGQDEPEPQPVAVEEPTPAPVAEDTTAQEAVAQVEEPVVEEEPEPEIPARNTGGTGEISEISERTGRTYVVVGSFFDGDLANDLGQRLISDGRDVKIIKPDSRNRFHRVAVADYATYAEAVNVSERFKSEFGPEVWALKY